MDMQGNVVIDSGKGVIMGVVCGNQKGGSMDTEMPAERRANVIGTLQNFYSYWECI